jgi:hypothetical protein
LLRRFDPLPILKTARKYAESEENVLFDSDDQRDKSEKD